ncbi:MAG: phosphonate metabolism transcriptional regulator PhnF [Pseudomonadota bacterium]
MTMNQQATIDRRQGVAMWRQIADIIRNQAAGELASADGKLPPEHILAEKFGCNRHTVRAAIKSLVDEGVLRAEQGRGTFLQPAKRLTYPISRRTRFTEGLGSQTRSIERILLGAEIEPAPDSVATPLNLTPQQPAWRLETLSKADGRAISRATSWFDASRFTQMGALFARHQSTTRALQAQGISDYHRQSTQVEAMLARNDDLDDLQLSPGAAVLVTRSVNVDPAGEPIEFAITRFAADRVTIDIVDSQAVPG